MVKDKGVVARWAIGHYVSGTHRVIGNEDGEADIVPHQTIVCTIE